MEAAWGAAFDDVRPVASASGGSDPATPTEASAAAAASALPSASPGASVSAAGSGSFVGDDDGNDNDDDDDHGAGGGETDLKGRGALRSEPAGRVYPLGGVRLLPEGSVYALRSRPAGEVGSSDEEEDEEDEEAAEACGGGEFDEIGDDTANGLSHHPLVNEDGDATGADAMPVTLPALPTEDELYGEAFSLHATAASTAANRDAGAAATASRPAASSTPLSAHAVRRTGPRQRQSLRRMDAGDPEMEQGAFLADGRAMMRRMRMRERPVEAGEASSCSCVCVLQLIRMVCCCIMPEWFADEDDAVEIDWDDTPATELAETAGQAASSAVVDVCVETA